MYHVLNIYKYHVASSKPNITGDHIDGLVQLVQDCSNSSALAMELL